MFVTRETIADKVATLFPNVSTAPGSKVDTILIQPLLNIFSGFDTADFEDLLVTRIKEFNPNLVISEGSANFDILIAPILAIIEPLWWEIQQLASWQSLANYSSIPNEELDALVANMFVTRLQGSKAQGNIRVYFTSPATVIFNKFVKFTTRSGLVFVPVTDSVIQADIMSFNQEGGLYYVDILVEAESEGDSYNIVSGQIISAEGLPTYSRVTNKLAFTGGTNTETNDELYTRTRDSITVRNLVTKKGIRYNLRTEFPGVKDIQVVGAGDTEMERDLIPYGINTTTTITQLVTGGNVVTISSVVVTGANYYHALGKSDVYLYVDDINETYKDIYDIDTTPISLSKNPPNQTNMPLVRVKDIERLDPVYLTETGQYIPYACPIDARAYRDFYFSTDENSLERAIGIVRLFFERPTSFSVNEDTVLTTEDGYTFTPIQTQTITASGMTVNTGQSITETQMEASTIYNQDIVYYYFDITVKSDVSGDTSTLLKENTYLLLENYTSEGWTLSSRDENYALSVDEELYLTFTATFNDGIPIDGESIRIIYEYSSTVDDIQTFVDDDEERVITTDILIKHFQPAYVDLAIAYSGEVAEEDIETYVRSFINSIAQGQYFEIADLINLLYGYGVTRVSLPIEVFVLILNKDRTYTAVRFEDRYKTEKRVHFIARNISIVKI